MNLEDLGEFGLIDRIRRSFARRSSKAPIGIGDDAAALCVSPGNMLLATTDMLIEGIHFDLATTDFYSLGWKSAAVNLSDIAAMGGRPRFCLVALAIPRRVTVEQIFAFYRGLGALLRKHAVLLVGGDTCSSKKDFVVTVVLLGESLKEQVLLRSGARQGDLIFVTGFLGDSAAGMELLNAARRDKSAKGKKIHSKLVDKHLRPVPRVEWGQKLAATCVVTSMIDVSDGLSSDLGHICDESRVGAEIHVDRLPLSKAIRSARELSRSPLEYALSGGEDYELLFTAPGNQERRVYTIMPGATNIGTITKARGMKLLFPSGAVKPYTSSGYDHFRSRERSAPR